jgi:hypothetical protein
MHIAHSLSLSVFREIIGAVILLLLTACAGNGTGLDANGQPIVPGETARPLSADFDSLQSNIFTPICSVCHVGSGAPEGLRLDAANSYNLLVGVPSTEVPSLLRVNPGDPDNSYLIQKLEGLAAAGAQMPLGGPYLSADTIALVRQWITNGAPASATAAVHSVDPLAVMSVVPDNFEAVNESPPQIMIAFNHDIDANEILHQSVRIERFTGGEPATVAEVVAARISVSSANPKVMMIWPGRRLTAGRYRVVMAMNSPAIRDMAGQMLAFGAPIDSGESVIDTFDVEELP